LEATFSAIFSEKATATLKLTLIQNQANVEFWKKYGGVSLPDFPVDGSLFLVIPAIFDKIEPLIRQKISAPLDAVAFSVEAQSAADALPALQEVIAEYNNAVDAANFAVTAVKKAVEIGNPATLRKELARLEAQRNRHSDALSPSCTEHLNLQHEKTETETQKNTAKKELDEYTEVVLQKYEEGINKLLDRFGAGFRISAYAAYGISGDIPHSVLCRMVGDSWRSNFFSVN
jgi:hypothetical protein